MRQRAGGINNVSGDSRAQAGRTDLRAAAQRSCDRPYSVPRFFRGPSAPARLAGVIVAANWGMEALGATRRAYADSREALTDPSLAGHASVEVTSLAHGIHSGSGRVAP